MTTQNKYTPKEIVECNYQFNIPLYQRLFAWRQKEITKLLLDLQEHFRVTEGDPSRPPYYLGMITCIDDGGQFDLIDGQQRFTVMMLLGICLKSFEPTTECWHHFLTKDNGPRLRFIAREEDQNYLADRIFSTSLKEGYVNRAMEEGLICIKKFLEGLGTDDARIRFSENVFERLTFFISFLPDSYKRQPSSLNKYFEAMNAHGKSLEQHEILKVELMRNTPYQEDMTKIWNFVSQTNKTIIPKQEDESEEFYRRRFLSIIQQCREGNYSTIIEQSHVDFTEEYTIDTIKPERVKFDSRFSGDGDISIVSFSELLLLTLDIFKGESTERYDANKLLSTFMGAKDNLDIWGFYNKLLLIRLLLDYYVVRREIINGQGDYTLVLRDDERTSNELRQYQAMLTVSTESLTWLRRYLQLVEKRDYNSQELLCNLKKIDNEKHHTVPKDSELCFGAIDRYWFWRLDYFLWANKEKYFAKEYWDAVEGYAFRRNRSIEHLHPQNEDNNASQKWTLEHINRFGNLAMISQSFNSEQSNDNLEIKFARIKEQIQNKSLQSLKLLLMYCAAEGSGIQWTEKVADVHQKEMIQLLTDSYSL